MKKSLDILDSTGLDHNATQSAANMLYSSRRGKNDSADNHQDCHSHHRLRGQGCFHLCFKSKATPQSCEGDVATPLGLEGRVSNQRVIFETWDLVKFAFLGFGLVWDLSPFPFDSSLWE